MTAENPKQPKPKYPKNPPKGAERLEPPLPEGAWLRTSHHDQGHRVARNREDAVCGLGLTMTLALEGGWVAVDERSSSHCARCKGKDYSDPYLLPPTSSHVSRIPVVTGSRVEALQEEAKVALVKALLGATEV